MHTELENIKVTAVHEFFHSIQFSYNCFERLWIMEASAVWSEDQLYNGVNDHYRYLNSWFQNIHSHPLACRLFWLRKNPGARPFQSCCGLSPSLEKHFEASQQGWGRVYLQLQDCDVRHLDV